MPKTAAFCDLSVRHPRSRPTTASSSSPDLTEKRLVFGASSFNGADFCRGKEACAGNTGRIVKRADVASGVNPPVKTIRSSVLLCYTYCEHFGTCYACSEHPLTGWREVGMLIPGACCTEVFCLNGQWFLSACEEGMIGFYEAFWQADGTVKVGSRLK